MTLFEFLQLLQKGDADITANALVLKKVSTAELTQMERAIAGHQTLTHLTIGVLNINPTCAFARGLQKNTTLRELKLVLDSCVGEHGFPALSRALKVSTTLTRLDLKFNFRSGEVGPLLASAITHNKSLKWLSLNSDNTYGGAEAVIEALRASKRLTAVKLQFSDTPPNLSSLLSNATFTSLDFKGLHLNPQDYQAIANSLGANISLQHLGLLNGRSSISQVDAEHLAIAVAFNSTLTSLSLSGTTLQQGSAQEIAGVLANQTSLRSLDLSSCQIIDDDLFELCTALETNNALQHLDLSQNLDDGDFLVAIADALGSNHALTSLRLGGVTLSDSMADRFLETFEINTTLLTFGVQRANSAEGEQQLINCLRRNLHLADAVNLFGFLNMISLHLFDRYVYAPLIGGVLHIAKRVINHLATSSPALPEASFKQLRNEWLLHALQFNLDNSRAISRDAMGPYLVLENVYPKLRNAVVSCRAHMRSFDAHDDYASFDNPEVQIAMSLLTEMDQDSPAYTQGSFRLGEHFMAMAGRGLELHDDISVLLLAALSCFEHCLRYIHALDADARGMLPLHLHLLVTAIQRGNHTAADVVDRTSFPYKLISSLPSQTVMTQLLGTPEPNLLAPQQPTHVVAPHSHKRQRDDAGDTVDGAALTRQLEQMTKTMAALNEASAQLTKRSRTSTSAVADASWNKRKREPSPVGRSTFFYQSPSNTQNDDDDNESYQRSCTAADTSQGGLEPVIIDDGLFAFINESNELSTTVVNTGSPREPLHEPVFFEDEFLAFPPEHPEWF